MMTAIVAEIRDVVSGIGAVAVAVGCAIVALMANRPSASSTRMTVIVILLGTSAILAFVGQYLVARGLLRGLIVSIRESSP